MKNIVWRNGWASYRLTTDGKQRWIALGTQDKDVAEAAADSIRRTVQAERIRSRLEAAGIRTNVAGNEQLATRIGLLRTRTDVATFDEIETAYLADVAGRTIKPRSAGSAVSSLRLVVATVKGAGVDVGGLRATVLTAELLHDYEAAKIATAKEEGPAALERALTTAASTITQARAVFCDEALQGAHMRQLKLPDLAAFKKFSAKGSTRKVRVEIDDATLERLRVASDDLWFQSPARWLAFALCCGVGLRRGEAKRARWDWVRQIRGTWVIYLVTSADGAPKGNEHKKEIKPSLWQDICEVRGTGDYIIPGTTEDDRDAVLGENVQWLRAFGFEMDKPNHELRAIYLQALDRVHGRAAAQLGGGHSDKRTTEVYTGRGTAPAVRPF